MNRRQFLGAAVVALVAVIPSSTYAEPVPDIACHPKGIRDIPAHALNGDCYVNVFTRGTYAGWPAPGVPV